MRHRIFNLIAVALGWGFDSWTEKEKVNVFLKGLQTKNGNIKKSMTQEHCTEKRGGDWIDLIANMTGIISAAAIGYYILRPYFKKKRNAGYSHERPTQ